MSAATDARVEELRQWVASQRGGAVVPERVTAEMRSDADDRPAWFFTIFLRDPPPDSDTWSVDAVADLERAILHRALELEVPWPWHIDIQPVNPEPTLDAEED